MIQPYPYNDPFTQKIISCCFYLVVFDKNRKILRFLVFRIHKDIENKDNMTNRILLHMPEHSQDILIHIKPFETIHDIEARLNPINKIQSDCPYIVLLIIFKYIYIYL